MGYTYPLQIWGGKLQRLANIFTETSAVWHIPQSIWKGYGYTDILLSV